MRVAVSHGVPIETLFGYSGAVKIGDLVHISGQLARDQSGQPVGGSFVEQLGVAYENMNALLRQLDLTSDDVIQVQLHVTASIPDLLSDIHTIHSRYFADTRPSMTVLRVAALNDPGGMVEISGVASSGDTGQHPHRGGTVQRVEVAKAQTSFAAKLGMSEAVRVGTTIFVSGQMATDADGVIMYPGQCAKQFTKALENVDNALRRLGSSVSKVVALDYFLTVQPTEEEFVEICDAHRAAMSETPPTGTMVRAVGLPLEGALVYISAIAMDDEG